jgi:hypothetical protein
MAKVLAFSCPRRRRIHGHSFRFTTLAEAITGATEIPGIVGNLHPLHAVQSGAPIAGGR